MGVVNSEQCMHYDYFAAITFIGTRQGKEKCKQLRQYTVSIKQTCGFICNGKELLCKTYNVRLLKYIICKEPIGD